MIKPYTGPIGKEVDEALYRARKAGKVAIPLQEIGPFKDDVAPSDHIVWVVTNNAEDLTITECMSTPAFLREFGRH